MQACLLGPRAHFDLLWQLECAVKSVGAEEFVALVPNRTNPGNPLEEIFPISDVNDADLGLLKPGAVFYWTMGYRINEGGVKTKGSELRFRRLPPF